MQPLQPEHICTIHTAGNLKIMFSLLCRLASKHYVASCTRHTLPWMHRANVPIMTGHSVEMTAKHWWAMSWARKCNRRLQRAHDAWTEWKRYPELSIHVRRTAEASLHQLGFKNRHLPLYLFPRSRCRRRHSKLFGTTGEVVSDVGTNIQELENIGSSPLHSTFAQSRSRMDA